MPVYGGIRATRANAQKHVPTRMVIRQEIISSKNTKQTRRKYIEIPGNYWPVGNTPLIEVERKLKFPIQKWIQNRARQTGLSQNVLDWGCETGKAIQTLADAVGKKAHCYGYSMEQYPEWRQSTNVNYIHSTKEDLFRYFPRKKFDLIFSTWGLNHLRVSDEARLPRYLAKLSQLLSNKGEIVLTPFRSSREDVAHWSLPSNHERAMKEREVQRMYQAIIDPTGENYRVTLIENVLRVKRIA